MMSSRWSLNALAMGPLKASVYDGEARAVPVHIYYPRRSYFMEFLPFCVTLIAQVGHLVSNMYIIIDSSDLQKSNLSLSSHKLIRQT